MLAPKLGTGLVIAKLPNGTWSPPSAIASIGISWGFLAGADVTDFIIILNTQEAVSAFAGIGNIQIGAGLDVAVGPVGRGVSGGMGISDRTYAPALSYSHSKGLFVGVSLDGSLILTRTDVNHKFYGIHHEPLEILSGAVAQPRACEPLYHAINSHIDGGKDDNEEGIRTSNAAGQHFRADAARQSPAVEAARRVNNTNTDIGPSYNDSFFDESDRINI